MVAVRAPDGVVHGYRVVDIDADDSVDAAESLLHFLRGLGRDGFHSQCPALRAFWFGAGASGAKKGMGLASPTDRLAGDRIGAVGIDSWTKCGVG